MVVMNAGCSGGIKTLFVATCHLKNNNNNKFLQDLMNSTAGEVRKVAPDVSKDSATPNVKGIRDFKEK